MEGMVHGFSACSVSCGGGVRQRERQCDNPKPKYPGKTYEELGPSTETQSCNVDEPCPGKQLCKIYEGQFT